MKFISINPFFLFSLIMLFMSLMLIKYSLNSWFKPRIEHIFSSDKFKLTLSLPNHYTDPSVDTPVTGCAVLCYRVPVWMFLPDLPHARPPVQYYSSSDVHWFSLPAGSANSLNLCSPPAGKDRPKTLLANVDLLRAIHGRSPEDPMRRGPMAR